MEKDVASLVWSKLVINVGINALTALIGQTNGMLLRHEETKAIMADLVAEAVAVARARGVRFTYDDPLATVYEVAGKTGANRSSMLQDFDKGRESEIDFMNGAIVREAAALGSSGARERHHHAAREDPGPHSHARARDDHCLEKKLLGAVDRDELAALTRSLVRIDSVIRPDINGTETNVVRFLAGWIRRELGVEPLVQEVEKGRENIIATLDSGAKGPCLMLEGHTDVVSEGNRSLWSRDPFGGDVADGRIYGRGACDMKAGLAVALVTAKTLLQVGDTVGREDTAGLCL